MCRRICDDGILLWWFQLIWAGHGTAIGRLAAKYKHLSVDFVCNSCRSKLIKNAVKQFVFICSNSLRFALFLLMLGCHCL